MAKLLKIVSRIIGGILEWVLILVIFVAFAVRTSAVQTFIAQKATAFLSKEMDAEFRIGKVDLYSFDRVALDDVFVRDQQGDTLASLGSIKVELDLFSLGGSRIVIDNITLKEGRVGLNRDTITGDYNYWFITDYFDSGPSKKPKKKTNLTINSLDIDNVHLTYDDYRKTYNEFGMDYDHLDLRNVQLHARNFTIRGKEYAFVLDHLSAKEKSGLDLKRLQAKCAIGSKGIYITDLKINTFHSRIFASKFNLVMDGMSRIKAFEDSVSFDARIDSSIVNLYDVSLFAPALKGMHQKIMLQASLSQKVKNLKISGIDLRTGKKTIVRGDLLLPDFDTLEISYLKENLDYAYIDLEDIKALRLPDKAESQFIALTPIISRLGYVEVKKTNIEGYWSKFLLTSQQIQTALGTVHIDNGLRFRALKEGGYAFERERLGEYDVLVDSFNLGKFLDDPMFGNVQGAMYTAGVVGQEDQFRLTEFSGQLNNIDFNNYTYDKAVVTDGSFINNIFAAHVDVEDPHALLTFDGTIDVSKNQEFNFVVNVPRADLGTLNFVSGDSTYFAADMTVYMKGTGISDYGGTIDITDLTYKQDSLLLNVPRLSAVVIRGTTNDVITIRSNIADAEMNGKIDPKTIGISLNNAFVPYLSSYLKPKPFPKGYIDHNYFDLSLTIGQPEQILALFAPGLSISNGTKVDLHYNAANNDTKLAVNSGEVKYNNLVAKTLVINQSTLNGTGTAAINAAYFKLNDSLYVSGLNIDINGANNLFTTTAKWNEKLQDSARFEWSTQFADSAINVNLKPSFFTIKGQTWDVMNTAKLSYADHRIAISHLVLERDVQFVSINGIVSDRKEDVLNIDLNELHLQEFSAFIDPDLDIAGNISGNIHIATPFSAFRIDGNITAQELFINKQAVGDVNAKGEWDAENERIKMNGDLKYLKNETFDFAGSYYPYRKDNNISFDLSFVGMDLLFANAFVDPDVVRDMKGNLRGNLKVTGKANAPTIDGTLNLENGSVKVELLGSTFKMSGPIKFNGAQSAFYVNQMPVFDAEGHKATLNASILHTDYQNWNCDIGIDINDTPGNGFLVLNTKYEEGTIYNGRAYVTGTTNINISDATTEILVDVKTEPGTNLNIPMYGNSEISESDIIEFHKIGTEDIVQEIDKKIDLSGVQLDLNFDVTPDAKVKLIFNEKTGDEISVNGSGAIGISVNNLGDVNMVGTYTVNEGAYNFVMGPVKQNFIIEEGGSITWTGDPTNANLNLTTYRIVTANFSDVGVSNFETGNSANQNIYCILQLTQTLNDPVITLNIEAPKATESERTVLASIKSDKDELQKQFFSLLLLKKFVPLNGSANANGGGLADVISTQINTFLSQYSEEVKIGVATTSTNEADSYELNLEKTFGPGDRIIFRTSLGVANSNIEGAQGNNYIGDMSVEYLINDDGSFRVNLFNESNDNSVVQDKSKGQFTQGVGLHYQEDFNTIEDFKLIQFVLDLFRKDKQKRITRTNRRVRVSVKDDAPVDNGPVDEPVIKPGQEGVIEEKPAEEEGELEKPSQPLP